jgi:hypothetical protein
MKEALKRLRVEIQKQKECLRDLRLSDPIDDKRRIEDMKGGLIQGSWQWVLSNSNFKQWCNDAKSQLLWIRGDPGKGKTMMLCGIINELQGKVAVSSPISYFFCQATDSRINSTAAVLRGLLYMLISQEPSLTSHVRLKYDNAGKSIFEDANALLNLSEFFINVLRDSNLGKTYIVVDALDECVRDMPKLLDIIAKQCSESSNVKWIVSSRNLTDIEEQLDQVGHVLSLELNAKSVTAAVENFISRKIEHLEQKNRLRPEDRSFVAQYLTENAKGTFLWVALVCQDLMATKKWKVVEKLSSFPPGLNELYDRMLQQVQVSGSAEICQRILAIVATSYRPVTISESFTLVEVLDNFVDDLESFQDIIRLCGSFLTLRDDTIYFVHQSAQDFLLEQASRVIFPHGKESVHDAIFSRSLASLSNSLHRDLYGLCAPGISVNDIKIPAPDPLAATRYSLVHWVDHLCDSRFNSRKHDHKDLQVMNIIHDFLKAKFLYWLEGLSLCGSIAKGVVSITRLHSLAQVRFAKTPD